MTPLISVDDPIPDELINEHMHNFNSVEQNTKKTSENETNEMLSQNPEENTVVYPVDGSSKLLTVNQSTDINRSE